MPENILLTGIPRSGTTLTCSLLHGLKNVVALQEPMSVGSWGSLSGIQEIYKCIDDFFAQERNRVREEGRVTTKHFNGKIVDNYFERIPGKEEVLGQYYAQLGLVRVDSDANHDLTMIVKHNAAFMALIPEINSTYNLYAVVRHPLWVLASWHNNNLPVHYGHMPVAELLDSQLALNLSKIEDAIDRQIHLLDWIFSKFVQLDVTKIIRYEDICASGGKILGKVTPAASQLNKNLKNRNTIQRYPLAPLRELVKRILSEDHLFFHLYPRESFEMSLLDKG